MVRMATSHARRDARAETREAILSAAGRRFARFGPMKTTMDEVAREARCSRATVYAHFPGKEALYKGLLERETQGFLREVESAVASSDGAARKLRNIVRATTRIYSDRPLLHGALSGDAEMALDRVARPAMRNHDKQVISLLRLVYEIKKRISAQGAVK